MSNHHQVPEATTPLVATAYDIPLENLDSMNLFAFLLSVKMTGGIPCYYRSGTYITNPPISSMVFGPEFAYIFIPDAKQQLVFEADAYGLHHIIGTGTVLMSEKNTKVYIFR